MVEQDQARCWKNSDEIEGWCPGCGGGRPGRYVLAADRDNGWLDELTICICAPTRPTVVDALQGRVPTCVYVIESDGDGKRWRSRCLFHGSKSQPPSAEVLALRAAIVRRTRWRRGAGALGFLSLVLIVIGSARRGAAWLRRRGSTDKKARAGVPFWNPLRGLSATPSRSPC